MTGEHPEPHAAPSTMPGRTLSADTLLAGFPAEVQISAQTVADAATGRVLIVLDDDPTGTQSVSDLPVLTQWQPQDFRWALDLGVAAIYVLTNTRSLDPAEAAARNEQVVTNALEAAGDTALTFVSRSDSTLRGHFPLEPEVIAREVRQHTAIEIDGLVIVPAFPDAGRVTIGGVHYMRSGDRLTPVSETEFAGDATFGFSHSILADYVEEKSGGRLPADAVIGLDLAVVRAGATAIADALDAANGGSPIVVDAVTENDLRLLALGLDESERRGQHFVYRVGPPFVRARIGQSVRAPLGTAEAFRGTDTGRGTNTNTSTEPAQGGGLIVVGSHVAMTTRQLARLRQGHPSAHAVEINVEALLQAQPASEQGHETHLDTVVEQIVQALAGADVILQTSRMLVKTADAQGSLQIARAVSAAVVTVVQRVVARARPRFVIAKGGITSSDVAALGLEIRRAMVRGPMLPGIVSLWHPIDGPAAGIPYVVFAGNVGDDESLLSVVQTLSAFSTAVSTASAAAAITAGA